MIVLSIVRNLCQSLDENGVTYCHWKSNYQLRRAISGDGDLDLLVKKHDYAKCLEILGRLGFKRAISISDAIHNGLEHYYGLDEDTGHFVHLHLYYRIVTGDSLVKNFRLPVEDLLFNNRLRYDCIYVPSREAELILFLIRTMLKQRSVVELLLFERDYDTTRCEARWLSDAVSFDQVNELVRKYLPTLPPKLLLDALPLLETHSPRIRRYMSGRKIAKCLGSYRRFSSPLFMYYSVYQTSTLVLNRLLKRKGGMRIASGGVVVAIVGPQATGKSTTVGAVRRWLEREFRVQSAHAGKPPSALLTAIPNAFLPMARLILPKKRSSYIETEGDTSSSSSLLHLVRVLALAFDRRTLILKMHRAASRGEVVISDRYVSPVPKAIDSTHFSNEDVHNTRSALKRWLMRTERDLYASIPAPDLVIALTVPVEVAIERDQQRDKKGPKNPGYIRRRHAMAVDPQFACHTEMISTLDDISITQRRVMDLIWRAL